MLLILVVTGTMVMVSGRLWFGLAVCWSVAGLLVIGSEQKISILRQPLVPADLTFLRTPWLILASADASAIAGGLLALAMTLAAGVIVGRRFARDYESPLLGHGYSIPLRVLGTAVGAGLLLPLFVQSNANSYWLRLSVIGGADWAPWSQFQNYAHNGFAAATMYSLPSDPMSRPSNYDEAALLGSVRRLGDGDDFVVRDNVIVVLSESFSDPAGIPGLAPARDPLATWRDLTTEAWSGWLRAPYYGTGTSAMEHQVLTAQNLAFFAPHVVSPYQQFVADRRTVESYAWWMRDRGAKTIAVHPYDAHFYRRDEVYPVLGFQEFYSGSAFRTGTAEHEGPFVSDAVTFDFVVDKLRTETSPLFVQVVTMQNHVPFPGHHEDPIDPGPALGTGERAEIGDYLRGLETSVQALDDFIRELESLGETTHLVYYGDHYPAIFSTARDETDEDEWRSLPFLVWSTTGLQPRDLGTISPTEVMPILNEAISWPSPPIFDLVRLAASVVGPFTRGDLDASKSVSTNEALSNLRQAQYALVEGATSASRALWAR
jgi:hypothetical protein